MQEINRVTTLGSFITVDAYRDEEEKARMFAWNLTAKTILSVKEWKKLIREKIKLIQTQSELSDLIINKWKGEEIKKIDKNPDDYIVKG